MAAPGLVAALENLDSAVELGDSDDLQGAWGALSDGDYAVGRPQGVEAFRVRG